MAKTKEPLSPIRISVILERALYNKMQAELAKLRMTDTSEGESVHGSTRALSGSRFVAGLVADYFSRPRSARATGD